MVSPHWTSWRICSVELVFISWGVPLAGAVLTGA
jgi:hypothetical protein